MKLPADLAVVARRMTRLESGGSLFRLPRHRNVGALLSTARMLLQAVEPREAELVAFGLPSGFMSEFKTLVTDLQRALEVRLAGSNPRRGARARVADAIRHGLEAVLDLDAIVRTGTRDDQATAEAWRGARRTEGQRSTSTARPSASAPVTPIPPPSTPDAAASGSGKSKDSLEHAS